MKIHINRSLNKNQVFHSNSQAQTIISSSARKNTFYRQFINKSPEEQRKLVPVILSKIFDLEIEGKMELSKDDLSEIEFLNEFRGLGALFKNSEEHLTKTSVKIIEFIKDNHADLMSELLVNYKADKSVPKRLIIESMVSEIHEIRHETKLKDSSSISTEYGSGLRGNSFIGSIIEEQDAISEDNVENYLQCMMEADAQGVRINFFDRTNADKLLDACKSNVKILERIIHSSKEVRDCFFSVTKYDTEAVDKILIDYLTLCIEPSSKEIECYLVCLYTLFERNDFESDFARFIFSKLQIFFPKLEITERKKLLKFGFNLEDSDPIKHYFITARNSQPIFKDLANKISSIQQELILLQEFSTEKDIVIQLIMRKRTNLNIFSGVNPPVRDVDFAKLEEEIDIINRLLQKSRKYSIDTTEELVNLLEQRAYLLENKISEYRS